MAQKSDELKEDIERTREQMAETADALAYKADVPTRTKEWIGEKKDALTSAVSGASSKVGEVTPDGAEVSQSMGRMKRLAERNPLGLAIGGAAVGFIAGLLAPSTRLEDERIGPVADDVKATAAEAGREYHLASDERALARDHLELPVVTFDALDGHAFVHLRVDPLGRSQLALLGRSRLDPLCRSHADLIGRSVTSGTTRSTTPIRAASRSTGAMSPRWSAQPQ